MYEYSQLGWVATSHVLKVLVKASDHLRQRQRQQRDMTTHYKWIRGGEGVESCIVFNLQANLYPIAFCEGIERVRSALPQVLIYWFLHNSPLKGIGVKDF